MTFDETRLKTNQDRTVAYLTSFYFSTLSPARLVQSPADAKLIIRAQVARLQERLDSVNRDLVTCIKSRSDVNEALKNSEIGEIMQ